MSRAAKLEFASEAVIDRLAEQPLNGRQIRNLTRLARILYSDSTLTWEQMEVVIHYGGFGR